MEEIALVNRLKQGEEAAFKTIVETWQSMVYNTALSIVQQAADAEDVAQEVFVQVYQSIRSFKGDSKFSTWLYRITITKALDHERRKKRKKRFAFISSLSGSEEEVQVAAPGFHHPGVLMDQKENAAALFMAIKQLPENQKLAFTLHKMEGLSYQEVSEVMGNTIPAVESLLHRARLNLRKTLEDHFKKS